LKGNTLILGIAQKYGGRAKGWHCALWGAISMIAGCSAPATQHLSVQVAADETSFVTQALDATVTQFIGPQTGSTGAGRAGGTSSVGLGGITANTLSPGSGTAYTRSQSQRRLVALDIRQPLPGSQDKKAQWQLTGRLALGQGNSQYLLPEGAGILKDPIRIDFDTHFASAETGLAWQRPFGTQSGAELGLAVGQRLTQSHTQISSALLDVRNDSWQTGHYLALRAGLWLQPNPASRTKVRLDLEALGYPGQGGAVGSVLQIRY
jgi:hypothetical protein